MAKHDNIADAPFPVGWGQWMRTPSAPAASTR